MQRLSALSAIAILLLSAVAPAPAQATHTSYPLHFGAGNVPVGCTQAITDNCYHIKYDINPLYSAQIDVLIVPPASPMPERDARIMRQAIEMWDAGLHYLARDMGLDWLADGVGFNILVDDGTLSSDPLWDPEIVVIASNPVGGAGIGIMPVGFRNDATCKGENPFAGLPWDEVPDFDNHHGNSGTYVDECNGDTTCYAINGAIDPEYNTINLFNLFDLVAHEVGHCLTLGHVGNGLDGNAATVPCYDIMAYQSRCNWSTFPLRCVSTLNVEAFAIGISAVLDGQDIGPGPLASNGNTWHAQHPSQHYYATSEGSAWDAHFGDNQHNSAQNAPDCIQPDVGPVAGEPVNFYPEGGSDPDPDGSPEVAITAPANVEAGVAFPVTGTVNRVGSTSTTTTTSSTTTTTSSSSTTTSPPSSCGGTLLATDSPSDSTNAAGGAHEALCLGAATVGTDFHFYAKVEDQEVRQPGLAVYYDFYFTPDFGTLAGSEQLIEVIFGADGSMTAFWDISGITPAGTITGPMFTGDPTRPVTATMDDDLLDVTFPLAHFGIAPAAGNKLNTVFLDVNNCGEDATCTIITDDLVPDAGSVIYTFGGAGSSAPQSPLRSVVRVPGISRPAAAMSAPTEPPVDPEIVDETGDVTAAGLPLTQMDLEAGWFDEDADNLYVGLKLADIPADASSTAFINYQVSFKPDWAPTWEGVPAGNTFSGLRVTALYSPAGLVGITPTVEEDTRYELQHLSTSAAQSNFGTVAELPQSSLSTDTDIIWWVVPKDLLTGVAEGDSLTDLAASAAPAVGGVVTFAGNVGDQAISEATFEFADGGTEDPPTLLERVEVYVGSTLLFTDEVASASTTTTHEWNGEATLTGTGSAILTAKWFDANVPSTGTPLATDTATVNLGTTTSSSSSSSTSTSSGPIVVIGGPIDGTAVEAPVTFEGTFDATTEETDGGLSSPASAAPAGSLPLDLEGIADLIGTSAYDAVVAKLESRNGFLAFVPTGPKSGIAVIDGKLPKDTSQTIAGWKVQFEPGTPELLIGQAGAPPQHILTDAEHAELAERLAALNAPPPTGPALPPTIQDGIGPGSALQMGVNGVESVCTASFLLEDTATGKYYLSTAGHCLVRDTSDPAAYTGAANPTKVLNYISICVADCLNNGLGLGEYIVLTPSGSYHPVAYAKSGGIGDDFGLIEIPSGHWNLLRPWMPQWGGPTGVDNSAAGDLMAHYGHGALLVPGVAAVVTRTPVDQGRLAVGLGDFGDGSLEALGHVTGGDSGSGIGTAAVDDARGVSGAAASGVVTHSIIYVGAPLLTATTLTKGLAMASTAGFTTSLVDASDVIRTSGGTTGPVVGVTFTAPAAAANLDKSATPTVTVSGSAVFPDGAGSGSQAPLTYFVHRDGCGSTGNDVQYMDRTAAADEELGNGCGNLAGLNTAQSWTSTVAPGVTIPAGSAVTATVKAFSLRPAPGVVMTGTLSAGGASVGGGDSVPTDMISLALVATECVEFVMSFTTTAAIASNAELSFGVATPQGTQDTPICYEGGDQASRVVITPLGAPTNSVQLSVDDETFDAENLLEVTGSAGWSASWDLTEVAIGAHTLYAQVVQNGVPTGPVASRAVTVQGAIDPPEAPIVQVSLQAVGGTEVFGWSDVATQSEGDSGTWSDTWLAEGIAPGDFTLSARLVQGTTVLALATDVTFELLSGCEGSDDDDGGEACTVVPQVAPKILPGTTVSAATVQQGDSATVLDLIFQVRDSNGKSNLDLTSTGITVEFQDGNGDGVAGFTALYGDMEVDELDPVSATTRDVMLPISVAGTTAIGDYTLVLTVKDKGDAAGNDIREGSATYVGLLEVVAEAFYSVEIIGGGALDFGSLYDAEGEPRSNVATQNYFVVQNAEYGNRVYSFWMNDFTGSVDSNLDTIAVQGNMLLRVDSTPEANGEFTFVDAVEVEYSDLSTQVDIVPAGIAHGAKVGVKLILNEVPEGLAADAYSTSFTVFSLPAAGG